MWRWFRNSLASVYLPWIELLVKQNQTSTRKRFDQLFRDHLHDFTYSNGCGMFQVEMLRVIWVVLSAIGFGIILENSNP